MNRRKRKRKIVICLVVAVALLVTVFLLLRPAEISNNNGVLFHVDSDSVVTTEAKFVIENKSESFAFFDDDFWLERRGIFGWYQMISLKYATSVGNLYSVDPHSQRGFRENWSDIYGALEPGAYRMVKKITLVESQAMMFFSEEKRTVVVAANFEVP